MTKEPKYLSETDQEMVDVPQDIYFYCTFSFIKDVTEYVPSDMGGYNKKIGETLTMKQLVLKNVDPIEYFAFRDDCQLVFAHEISVEMAARIENHMTNKESK